MPGIKPPKGPNQGPTDEATNSSTSTSSSSSTQSSTSSSAAATDKPARRSVDSMSELELVPSLVLKSIVKYIAGSAEGAKKLSIVSRVLFDRLRGLEAGDSGNTPLVTTTGSSEAEKAKRHEEFLAVLKAVNPKNALLDSRCLGIIHEMAEIVAKQQNITVEEFHKIMGREFIYARDHGSVKEDYKERLNHYDYAIHIAHALNLTQLIPDDKFSRDNMRQNLLALWKLDLTKIDIEEVSENFQNRKTAVERIKACASSGNTQLDLSGLKLKTLPPEIFQLTGLQELNLSNNQLTTLPAEICQLTALQNLSLSHNQLTTLPAEICQLTGLRRLFLKYNHLSALPAQIGNLKSLETLNICYNQLTSLATEIGNFTSLRHLVLNNNHLTALPNEVGQLTTLETLFLDKNQISTLPDEICNLTNLNWLFLRENPLIRSDDLNTLLNTLKTKGQTCKILM